MIDANVVAGVSVAIVSFVVGYTFAKIQPRSFSSKKEPNKQTVSDESTENVFAQLGGEYKMVLVVRNDLKMGKGKIAAQCGHAAVGAFERAAKNTPAAIKKWQNGGQAKIAVKVDSEEKMMEIYRIARMNSLNCCLIRDAGRTQIEPNTKTVLAIGPAQNALLDSVTGDLKLL